jgi:uncharacterized protein (DUF2252 family)
MNRATVSDSASPAARRADGKALRGEVPRSSHAGWRAAADRRDPLDILEQEERTRIPELIAIRHGRMAASPFAFLRGAAGVMAADLATTPTCGLQVQACGDAHLLNFGVFATPERNLVFDLNDFDETLPGPFEWDVKRLAASVVVAAHDRGFSRTQGLSAARASLAAYRTRIAAFAELGHLDIWYSRIDVNAIVANSAPSETRPLRKELRKATRHTNLGALEKLTTTTDGGRRIVDQPPLVEHVEIPEVERTLIDGFTQYLASLPDERRVLVQRYRLVDWARKVVGVGSVGTNCNVLLLMGDSDADPLFLQVKEAEASVLEPHAGKSRYENQGERVVRGQRLTQAASDIFLGWIRLDGRDAYIRQLRDMKGSANIDKLAPLQLKGYAQACGAALARAHARTGDPVAIAGYLGRGEAFDHAVAEFASDYAAQTERDHAALVDAISIGRLEATQGV